MTRALDSAFEQWKKTRMGSRTLVPSDREIFEAGFRAAIAAAAQECIEVGKRNADAVVCYGKASSVCAAYVRTLASEERRDG